MSKETPACELSDGQIGTTWNAGLDNPHDQKIMLFARAIVAADRELRRGDAAMTVAQWQKRHPDEEAGKWQNTDEFDAKWWRDNSRAWEVRSLIATEDAQAALAAKDVEIAEMKKDLIFVERWANHHGQKPHTSAKEALSCIQHYPPIRAITRSYVDGKVPETRDPYAELAALTAERDALHKDAERYQLLRRGQHWSVINGIGDALRAEQLDSAIAKEAAK